jgi:riboflavin kinase/FMN adenylyltransferase
MDIFKNPVELPEHFRDAVVSIGNFDGMHRGHQALCRQGRALADAGGKAFCIITFDPHPRRLFRPDDPPFLITPALVREQLLRAAGVDVLIELTFDWAFASQSPRRFIETVLTNTLRAPHLIAGGEFRFGQMREGSVDDLTAIGLSVTEIEKVADDTHGIISCSMIRQALTEGNLPLANRLLGWEWEMQGVVEKGEQRGRTLGFPTANVPLGDTLHPAYGVYATWVKIVDDGPDAPWLPSATNIGIRPMFEILVGQIESFIFDFDRDIYGKTLRIRPAQRLRSEAKFDSLDQLVTQMEQDCRQAREILQG